MKIWFFLFSLLIGVFSIDFGKELVFQEGNGGDCVFSTDAIQIGENLQFNLLKETRDGRQFVCPRMYSTNDMELDWVGSGIEITFDLEISKLPYYTTIQFGLYNTNSYAYFYLWSTENTETGARETYVRANSYSNEDQTNTCDRQKLYTTFSNKAKFKINWQPDSINFEVDEFLHSCFNHVIKEKMNIYLLANVAAGGETEIYNNDYQASTAIMTFFGIDAIKVLPSWVVPFSIFGISAFAIPLIITLVSLIVFVIKSIGNRSSTRTKDVIEEIETKESENAVAHMNINKNLFKISMEDIKVIKKIGSGGFSSIILGEYSNMKIAFKIFQIQNIVSENGPSESFEIFEKELELISSLHHNHIVDFYGACLDIPRIGLVLEFCSNGDLKQYLTKNQVSVENRIKILHGIVKGMTFLASKNVIHRDLKPENILIDENECAKITDFGLSRIESFSNAGAKTVKIGTSLYMSPEVFRGEPYSLPADVFSFGILIHNVLSLKFDPRKIFGKNAMQCQSMMASNHNYRPRAILIPEEIRKKYPWLIRIMKHSWGDNPESRPTFEKINKFFHDYLDEKD